MSAYSDDKKTLAYQLGESLSRDDRPLPADDGHAAQGRPGELLPVPGTARQGCLRQRQEPRRGDAASTRPRSICGGSRKPWSPFPTRTPARSRRSSPSARSRPSTFELNDEEFDFYDELTRYVEDQSIKAAADDSARGRAVGFTMAMLQRRFASSIYAVRRSLERMKDKREKILADPEAYRQAADRRARPRRLRRPARRRAAGDHRRARRRGRLGRSGRAARGNRRTRHADRPGPASWKARSRVQARQAARAS